MSRDEVLNWVQKTKWVLVDMGYSYIAGEYEDIETRMYIEWPAVDLKAYMRRKLPSGKRGHIIFVLDSPVNARAMAFLFGLVKSLDDDGLASRSVLV